MYVIRGCLVCGPIWAPILSYFAQSRTTELNSPCWLTGGNDAGVYTLRQNLMRIPSPGYFIPQ